MNILDTLKTSCHTNWQSILTHHLDSYANVINNQINKDLEIGHDVYPKVEQIFNAFNYFNMDDLKVVIIGQDCYHSLSKNEKPFAHGLCFSVPQECNQCPPSLKVIFKELEAEYDVKRTNTNLEDWAKQGVLLLNCALTVRQNKAGSHMKIWIDFTKSIIRHITEHHKHVVYILWGEFAKGFATLINENDNMILTCRHPSPLAYNKGPFIGNNHFKLANDYLEHNGKGKINWIEMV